MINSSSVADNVLRTVECDVAGTIPVPPPASLAMLATGLAGVGVAVRIVRRRQPA